jgi:hypothetical protein
MKMFWLLSVCTKSDSRPNHPVEFHFKGTYKGETVKRILLANNSGIFGKNKTYLLLLKETSFLSGAIYAELVKYKEIVI